MSPHICFSKHHCSCILQVNLHLMCKAYNPHTMYETFCQKIQTSHIRIQVVKYICLPFSSFGIFCPSRLLRLSHDVRFLWCWITLIVVMWLICLPFDVDGQTLPLCAKCQISYMCLICIITRILIKSVCMMWVWNRDSAN